MSLFSSESLLSPRKIASFLCLTTFVSACGIHKEPMSGRSYVPTLESEDERQLEERGDEPLMRHLPNDSMRGYGACRWLQKTVSAGGNGRFRLVERVSIPDKSMWEIWKRPIKYTDLFQADNSVRWENLAARTDIAANPLYLFALAYFGDKDDSIPNSAEFFRLFDRQMFSNPIFFPGFLALRALLTLGIVSSVDARNKQIQKVVEENFPASFASSKKDGVLTKALAKPLIRNGTARLGKLSPWAQSSLSQTEREQKFWKIMNRYSQAVPLFTSKTWRNYNDEMRNGMSVAVDAWSSSDPEEQACANIIFQRGLAQLLTIMGHDRPGFHATGGSSVLFEIENLLNARDGTKIRVCPTPGSFVKNGRRSFIALDDFVLSDARRPKPEITRGPYVAGPCSSPVDRSTSAYRNFQGDRLSSSEIGQGNALIDFLSSASQYMIALNPGATWWENKTYPLFNLDTLDSLENSRGVLPALSYGLSLGLMYIGLEKVLANHLVMVDFQGKRTTNEDNALGVRISDEPDRGFKLTQVTTDAYAAFRMAELAFKLSETLDRLALWNYRQIRSINNNPSAKAKYLDAIKGMFASEKNLEVLVGTGKDGARARLKKLQLATTLLIGKFAKQKSNGLYTCHTQLKTNLETGAESAVGDCGTEAPHAEKLFKELAGIMAKRYASPIFADYAKTEN